MNDPPVWARLTDSEIRGPARHRRRITRSDGTQGLFQTVTNPGLRERERERERERDKKRESRKQATHGSCHINNLPHRLLSAAACGFNYLY